MNELTIGWISIVLAMLGYLVGQFVLSWDMHRIRRCQARFPMFAARDRLVELVADGRMLEDDPAWTIAYIGTNIWLNPRHSHSVWAGLSSYMRYEMRLGKDKKAAKRASRLQSAILESAEKVPEFQDVILDIDRARRVLMRSYTHLWDRIAISILLFVGYLMVFGFRLLRSLMPAKRGNSEKSEKQTSTRVPVVRLRPRDVYQISNHTPQSEPDLATLAGGLIAWSGKFAPDAERRVTAN